LRRLLGLSCLAWIACGGAKHEAPPPPPSFSPSTSSSVATPIAPPPSVELGLVGYEPPAYVLLAESELRTTHPAFTGRVERIALPPNTPAIASMAARSASDIWMLTKAGAVLRWDGKRVTARGAPKCFVESCCGTLIDCKKKPALCAKASAECSPFGGDCAMEVGFSSIRVESGDVIVGATIETGGMRSSVVDARLAKNGSFTCEQRGDDRIYPDSRGRGDGAHPLEITVGGASIRFEGPARLVNSLGGYSLVIDGRRVPLPSVASMQGMGGPSLGFAARSPADLWLWTYGDEGVWRGNGLGWTKIVTGLLETSAVFFTEPNFVWVLGAEREGADPELVRWDPEAGVVSRFETPGASHVVQGKGGAFWLAGKGAVHRFDGRELVRADVPFEIEEAWLSPSGELWVVGADSTATVTIGEETVPMAAFARLTPPGEKKP